MSNYERSGWRDGWISERHRHWGDLPCVNLDCVVTAGGAVVEDGWLEYDRRRSVAIIEYKDRLAQTQSTSGSCGC